MTNQEKKLKKWDEIKDEFLKHIPEEYSVELVGIEEDTQYIHPTIKLSEKNYIRSQVDSVNKIVYAIYYHYNDSENGLWGSINIGDYQNLNDFLTNYEGAKEIADQMIAKQVKLTGLKAKIDLAIQDIIHVAFEQKIESLRGRKNAIEIKRNLEDLLIQLQEERFI